LAIFLENPSVLDIIFVWFLMRMDRNGSRMWLFLETKKKVLENGICGMGTSEF
jgi:hypothetical protein